MSNIINQTPVLYGSCIAVKGYIRSVICDLEKNQIHFIPNDLYKILTKDSNKTINEIFKVYFNKYDDIIYDYFVFLNKKGLIFFTKKPYLFPSINNDWYEYGQISNCIIDADNLSSNEFNIIIKQLDKLYCKNLEIRFFNLKTIKQIESILQQVKDKRLFINSINLIIKYSNYFNSENIFKICNKFPRLSNIIIYDSLMVKTIQNPNSFKQNIQYTTSKIYDFKNCGNINSNNFAINKRNYTESKKYNSCLNQKISIDINGDIKNCPSMKQSFGNIKDTTLEEALNHKDFKKYWNITKDQIDICKDCEFRYVCTDCRAYIENPEDKFSKPLKCGYSPYTNEWEEWSTNPLKQKAIEYYGMQDLVKQKDA